MKSYFLITLAILTLACHLGSFSQINYPGRAPGGARASHNNDSFVLENDILKMVFQVKAHRLHPAIFVDKERGDSLSLTASGWFSLALSDGKNISDTSFELLNGPVVHEKENPGNVSSYAGSLPGKVITAVFVNKRTGLNIAWEASLEEGANYIRQSWTFQARDSLPIVRYEMLKIAGNSLRQMGTVDGSPLVYKGLFFSLEHPMSKIEKGPGTAGIYLRRLSSLKRDDRLVITTAIGLTPPGQLRRGFLYYVERERAHPYTPYLHYNSWYDLSWIDRKMEESSCLDRIKTYGDSLVVARHIPLKAFLFDDGWDNDSTLWQINSGFPNGFSKMNKAAAGYGAKLGVWISPWGGYEPEKIQRLNYGSRQHPAFETNNNGFSLAGPVYFHRFREVASHFITSDGVNIFKFDGVGAGNGASGAGVTYQKDIDALLLLTRQLRQESKDIYFSLTVGTWPSPYWLYYGDAIWRAGEDFGYSGGGSKRQQWITYRDAQNYQNIVKRAPLFPLNAVMLHGICISNIANPKDLEMDDHNVSDEIWSFFGSGTALQELYINPHLLTSDMWDQLAAAARWSASNADVFSDVHWVGGDPGKDEVYGYAAWSTRRGVLTLRNPSSRPQTFVLDLQRAFELPARANRSYTLSNARESGRADKRLDIQAGKPLSITLQPYELRVWNADPAIQVE